MAGKLTANTLQIGDSATASQNFHLKSNVDGTLSLNRGNDGTPLQEVLKIDALGNVQLPVVDNTGAASDRAIPVGATVKIDAVGATSIPLRIATATDQIYEILMFGIYTPAGSGANTYLQINNTNFAASQFVIRQMVGANGTPSATSTTEPVVPGARLEAYGGSVFSVEALINTKTTSKRLISKFSGTTVSTGGSGILGVEWNDTTTAWTSLGTIALPNAWTGTVVVRRIL